jgi:hypothetical protein
VLHGLPQQDKGPVEVLKTRFPAMSGF